MIIELKKWLKKPGNTKVKLASYLGLGVTNTIDNWLFKNEVPWKHREKLQRVLDK